MKKDKKRKAALTAKAQTESLTFQTMYGARQKYGELTPAIEQRINEELMVFNNMHLADDLLRLKMAIDAFTAELHVEGMTSKGIMAGSVVAYCLSMEPTEPFSTGTELNPLDFQLPLELTISYDNDIRNRVVDWFKAHGYEMTTYLGQPVLRLPNIRVSIRRVIGNE